MSRLTTEITLDDIDDWFKIGKASVAKKPVKPVPRSVTGGRSYNPRTGEIYNPREDDVAHSFHSRKREESSEPYNYAAQYQALEEQQFRQQYEEQDAASAFGSVVGSLEQLELDSTVVGSVGIPEALIPDGATEVYKNYQFTHEYDGKLPITRYKEKVIGTIESNQVTIVQGSTGCGKTTQVPQYILDYYAKENKHCNIVVTQPRRIAAVSVAKRVCSERGWTLGTVCGYQIGLDNKTSEDTRLTYCTTGVLREKLIGKKNMHQYTHVILDEVHERDQETDFALLIVRKLLRSNSAHVKVILMSATIDCNVFANYFYYLVRNAIEPAPVISVEGRVFKVLEFFADDLTPALGQLPDFLEEKPQFGEEIQNMAVRLIREFDSLEQKEQGIDPETGFAPLRGTVLCFLPGYGEISDMYDKLRDLESRHNLKVIPLHSTITQEEQMRVFEPALRGQRKVILSTNIAESSITVRDIKYVVDFCLTKNLLCDKVTSYTHLVLEWASKANCTQRKGRAGRVSHGRCYFMVSKSFFEHCLLDFGTPEMQRCPLETLVLKTKLFNMGEPRAILGLALSPPHLDELERTILKLKEVGALATSSNAKNCQFDGELTFLGRVLADLPLDIHVGKLLVLGHVFCLLEECLIIAAALSLKSVFASPFKAKLRAYEHKLGWAASSLSDSIAILNAYKVWDNQKKLQAFKRAGMSERKWGENNFIQIRRINEVENLIKELEQRLEKFNIHKPRKRPVFKKEYESAKERLLLKLVLCGAFYPNYFIRESIDEVDVVRALASHDSMNTVMLKGIPQNQGLMHRERLQRIFSDCSRDPTPQINFEETKAYVQFPWKGNQLSETRVHPGVYMAIKLRLLNIHIEVESYTKDDAKIIASNVQKAQEELASQRQLRTNRLKGYQSTSVHNPQKRGRQVPPLDPSMAGVLIMITEIVECGHFWAQYNNDQAIAQLGQVQDTLNNPSVNLQAMIGPLTPGSYCAALFEDQTLAFYRARIVSVQAESVQVFFLDYGNTERVHREYVRALPDHLLEIPFQAFECVLAKLHPSPMRCPDGVWTKEANSWFRQLYLNQTVYTQVYSVVHEKWRVILIARKPNGQQVVVNEELIKVGFAEEVEEPYLSKQNHEQRNTEAVMGPTMRSPGGNESEEWMNVEMQDKTRAALKGSHRMVRLSGPHSPLEMSFHSMTFTGRLRSTRIEGDSVNSVAIDDEPQNPHSRLMIASFVGLNPGGTVVMARDTTIMPLIKGLPALASLLFAPAAELRTDRKRTKYIGALCGLGYDKDTNVPHLPENDMEVTFDVEIDNSDIEQINCVRLAINIAVGSQDSICTWGQSATEKLQKNARDRLLGLIERHRPTVEPENYENAYHWNQVDPEYQLEPGMDLDSETVMLLSPHFAVSLVQEDNGSSGVMDERSRVEYLKQHLQTLKTLSVRPRHKPLICQLCDVACPTPRMLNSHLNSEGHLYKENKLFSLHR